MDFLDFILPSKKITKLVIVGPYPSYEYISDLVRKFKIKEEYLFLVVDDAWNVFSLETDFKFKISHVCTDSNNGIVHAKMYYLEFEQSDNIKKNCNQLIVGSANASYNGMKYNAENFSSYKFDELDDCCKKIKTYFDRLSNGQSVNARHILLNSGKNEIFLPKINTSCNRQSFSSWLRSGKLFYKYLSDSNFGVISINLKQALPTAVDWGDSIFEKNDETNRSELKYRYLNKNGLVKVKREKKNLELAKYAVETNRGRWISKECYNEIKDEFKSTGKNMKQILCELNCEEIANIIIADIDRILSLNKKRNIQRCFVGVKNRVLDIVKKSVENDKIKCENETFCSRYSTGYEIMQVPNLSAEEWNDFVESWFAFCMMKGQKKQGIQNFLATTVKKWLITEKMKMRFSILNPDKPFSPDTLSKWFLYNDWNNIKYTSGKTLKQKICSYYKKKSKRKSVE